ncbi:MAG TPA: hypothetical protein VHV83_00585 [Armatimonadota bacterium]|nr:hypothetical protein [Armatimonadota bacterium]
MHPWRMLTVIPLLVLGFTSVQAQQVSLNGVNLNAKYNEVLSAKGMPHYIGPSLESADDITNILIPPPLPTTASAGGDTGLMPAMGADPGLAGGGFAPGVPVAPTVGTGGSTTADQKPKGQFDYVIWMYEGNSKNGPDKKDGFTTYVFFDKKNGTVIEVVTWLNDLKRSIDVKAPNSIALGSSLSKILSTFGYPKPFAKIGANFVCPYPDKQVTFSIDAATKKVIGIAVGRKPLTGISVAPTITSTPDAPPATAPGAAPGAFGAPQQGPPLPPGALPAPNGQPTVPR